MSSLTTSIRCIPSVPFWHTQNPYVHHKALLSYVENINKNEKPSNQQKTDRDRGLKGNTASSLLPTIYFDGKFDLCPYPV